MDAFSLDIEWISGGSSHYPIRANSVSQAKAAAGAILLEEDVYAMRSARLTGGPKTYRVEMPSLARGRVEWDREEAFRTLQMPVASQRSFARTVLMPKYTEFHTR